MLQLQTDLRQGWRAETRHRRSHEARCIFMPVSQLMQSRVSSPSSLFIGCTHSYTHLNVFPFVSDSFTHQRTICTATASSYQPVSKMHVPPPDFLCSDARCLDAAWAVSPFALNHPIPNSSFWGDWPLVFPTVYLFLRWPVPVLSFCSFWMIANRNAAALKNRGTISGNTALLLCLKCAAVEMSLSRVPVQLLLRSLH